MATQHRTAGGFVVLSGADRAAAALDRATWLGWKPSRDYQLAHALTDALIRSTNNGPVEQRIAQNVRTMR